MTPQQWRDRAPQRRAIVRLRAELARAQELVARGDCDPRELDGIAAQLDALRPSVYR